MYAAQFPDCIVESCIYQNTGHTVPAWMEATKQSERVLDANKDE